MMYFVGRYEDDFVLERMRYLQLWMDRMVRHPVISQSEVLNHFLTCTDDKVPDIFVTSSAIGPFCWSDCKAIPDHGLMLSVVHIWLTFGFQFWNLLCNPASDFLLSYVSMPTH